MKNAYTNNFVKVSLGMVQNLTNCIYFQDLWVPNIFIYDLKSFKSIEVLKRLAGENSNLKITVKRE